jgi:RND family efflux transporter MFP subunit
MRNYRGVCVACWVLVTLGCGSRVEPVTKSAPVLVSGVTVTALTSEAIPEFREAVGTVKAQSTAVILARLAGTVTRLYKGEGDRVAKGTQLIAIEAAESSTAAAAAIAGVEEAARALDEARSRKRLGEATLDRYRKLFAEQAVTRQEFEVRQSEQEVAAQAAARAEARLSQARHGAKAAGTVAAYGQVRSPIAGLVVVRQAEAGQTVFPGTPLFTIEGDEGFRLEVAAPEELLGHVKLGDQVEISLEGVPSLGRVSGVVPVVDPASRSFIVKIELPGTGYRSGSYGKALFRVGSRRGIMVPTAAVLERGALTSLWAVSREGIARLRLVKLGATLGSRVEVLSGVNAGDRVVTAGLAKVTDGAKVE